MKNIILTDRFRDMLNNLIPKLLNGYLNKMSTTPGDFVFDVTVREATLEPFVGCDSGSYGEPYHYVIEIDTDKPFPLAFEWNEEVSKDKNFGGFHNSVLTGEVKSLIPLMGVLGPDGRDYSIGVCFTNLR